MDCTGRDVFVIIVYLHPDQIIKVNERETQPPIMSRCAGVCPPSAIAKFPIWKAQGAGQEADSPPRSGPPGVSLLKIPLTGR